MTTQVTINVLTAIRTEEGTRSLEQRIRELLLFWVASQMGEEFQLMTLGNLKNWEAESGMTTLDNASLPRTLLIS